MGSLDDWFWAYGKGWYNYLASGVSGNLGYVVEYVGDSPIFAVGGAFQGWFCGVQSFGGDPSPDGTTGPATNDYQISPEY